MFRSNNSSNDITTPNTAPALNSYSPTAQNDGPDNLEHGSQTASATTKPAEKTQQPPAPEPKAAPPIPEPAASPAATPQPVAAPEPVISAPSGPPPLPAAQKTPTAVDPSSVRKARPTSKEPESEPAEEVPAEAEQPAEEEAPVIAVPDSPDMPATPEAEEPEPEEPEPTPAAPEAVPDGPNFDELDKIYSDKKGHHQTAKPDVAISEVDEESLVDIKVNALKELAPLIDELEQTPPEKFRTTMMLIQATDDNTMVETAYEAAHAIEDEKERAQALLDVVNEINYFTQKEED